MNGNNIVSCRMAVKASGSETHKGLGLVPCLLRTGHLTSLRFNCMEITTVPFPWIVSRSDCFESCARGTEKC